MRTTMIVLAVLVTAATTGRAGQSGAQPHRAKDFPEVTITGVVESFSDTGLVGCESCDACDDCAGSHVVVRTRTAHYEVHLAPAWFLELHGFVFNPGDTITVAGNRIRSPIWRGITARTVTRDGVVMRFRDEHGLPLWRRIPTDQ
jgi:hypothetical protein